MTRATAIADERGQHEPEHDFHRGRLGRGRKCVTIFDQRVDDGGRRRQHEGRNFGIVPDGGFPNRQRRGGESERRRQDDGGCREPLLLNQDRSATAVSSERSSVELIGHVPWCGGFHQQAAQPCLRARVNAGSEKLSSVRVRAAEIGMRFDDPRRLASITCTAARQEYRCFINRMGDQHDSLAGAFPDFNSDRLISATEDGVESTVKGSSISSTSGSSARARVRWRRAAACRLELRTASCRCALIERPTSRHRGGALHCFVAFYRRAAGRQLKRAFSTAFFHGSRVVSWNTRPIMRGGELPSCGAMLATLTSPADGGIEPGHHLEQCALPTT